MIVEMRKLYTNYMAVTKKLYIDTFRGIYSRLACTMLSCQ